MNTIKKCEICFGSCGWETGKRYKAWAELELRYDEHQRITFSCCGDIKTHSGGYNSCGQCLDRINDMSGQFNPTMQKLWKTVYRLWKQYHLNDMHAGTPEQEAKIKEAVEAGVIPNGYYNNAVEWLKQIQMYTVQVDGKDYTYGSGWLYEEIPTKDLQLINAIIDIFGRNE